MLGYKRGVPDLEFWEYQIKEGIKYRDECTQRHNWHRWRMFYRQDYEPGILPKNIYFEILQAIVPRLYFRNPTITATSQDGTFEGLIVSKIVEKITNKVFRMTRIKKTMQGMLRTGFFTGNVIGKFGFGGPYTPTPDEYENVMPLDKRGDPVAFADSVMDNMPWFHKVPTECFTVPKSTNSEGTNKWFEAMDVWRPLEEVKADPTYQNTSRLSETATMDAIDFYMGQHPGDSEEEIKLVLLREVRDRRNHRVFVYAPNQENTKADSTGILLYDSDDQLQSAYQTPFLPFVYNMDDERWWGIPYAKLIEPLQLEMNKIKDMKLKHMYSATVKFIYDGNAIDDEEVLKATGQDVGIGVKVKHGGMGKIKPMQVGGTPIDFYQMERELYNDLRQLVGLSRNEGGEVMVDKSHTNVTAEEIQAIRRASDLRLDSNRDQLSDIVVELARLIHSVIFKHWDQEMVINIAGENKLPLWVRFKKGLIEDTRFKLTVDPDTAMPKTREMKQQEALQLYQMTLNSPHVNHQEIMKLLLTEFVGVEHEKYLQQQMPMLPGQAMDLRSMSNLISQNPQQLLPQLASV